MSKLPIYGLLALFVAFIIGLLATMFIYTRTEIQNPDHATPYDYHEVQAVGTTMGQDTLTNVSSVTSVTKRHDDNLLSKVFGGGKEYLTVSVTDNDNHNISVIDITDWSDIYIVDDAKDVRLETWRSETDYASTNLLFITQDMLDDA